MIIMRLTNSNVNIQTLLQIFLPRNCLFIQIHVHVFTTSISIQTFIQHSACLINVTALCIHFILCITEESFSQVATSGCEVKPTWRNCSFFGTFSLASFADCSKARIHRAAFNGAITNCTDYPSCITPCALMHPHTMLVVELCTKQQAGLVVHTFPVSCCHCLNVFETFCWHQIQYNFSVSPTFVDVWPSHSVFYEKSCWLIPSKRRCCCAWGDNNSVCETFTLTCNDFTVIYYSEGAADFWNKLPRWRLNTQVGLRALLL